MDERAAIRNVLAAIPASIRRLAEEADVDDRLLRMIRDGDRDLTPAVRRGLSDALQRWEARCEEAQEVLEAADPEAGS